MSLVELFAVAVVPDFKELAALTGRERTTFKRDTLKPCLAALGPLWNPAEIASLFGRLLPHLEPDERAEVIASILAKGEYHPFRDGLHPSDVVRTGFVLDAKSVRYRFSYKSLPDAAARQITAYRTTGFLPGLIIVYQGKAKHHCVIFMPGLLRPNVSVTLNRVVDRPELWAWNKAKPVGILISQDGRDLSEFLTIQAHNSEALAQMEAAMASVAEARKSDPQIDKDWNDISQETAAAFLKTDIGQEALAAAEARGERRIFLKLCEVMPEAEARRITGYTGS